MSTIDSALSNPLRPAFPPILSPSSLAKQPETLPYIHQLRMQAHPEGGYFVETDRDPLRIPNPFPHTTAPSSFSAPAPTDNITRSASTTIFYLLTPDNPQGHFHRNKARTVHTLHRGRGRYVIVHADEVGEGSVEKARVETFVVGHDLAAGEKLQWIVGGGKYKASFLLPDNAEGSGGLLISETVVPGFEYADHDFMNAKTMRELVKPEQAGELKWLLLEKDE